MNRLLDVLSKRYGVDIAYLADMFTDDPNFELTESCIRAYIPKFKAVMAVMNQTAPVQKPINRHFNKGKADSLVANRA